MKIIFIFTLENFFNSLFSYTFYKGTLNYCNGTALFNIIALLENKLQIKKTFLTQMSMCSQ